MSFSDVFFLMSFWSAHRFLKRSDKYKKIFTSPRLAGVSAGVKLAHLHHDQGLVVAENIIVEVFYLNEKNKDQG